MIRYVHGDILKADAEALVNTVNCVGISGRGIAAQFKKAFPENFRLYESAAKRGEVEPGRMFVVDIGNLTNPRYIVNFPTKRHWRGNSRLEDIRSGLDALATEIRARGIRSIAVPPLGCGLGGLDWNDVRPMIAEALGNLSGVDVLVYEPGGAPAAEAMVRSRDVPDMTPGRAALVGLVDRYLGGLMDPFVTLLEVHKLTYFLQEAGEPLRLTFAKADYGPYAENLRHVLSKIEGHFLSGYADGGDRPDKELKVVPGAVQEAQAILAVQKKTQQRFDRVSKLVSGFESPYGLELLATVHWLTAHEGARTVEQAVQATHSWNARKRQFTPRQVGIAWTTLQENGWLN